MKKKNLVKILSIIFALIALSTCVALAVSAAGTSVNVNDETAYRGETVTFNATLSESVTVGSGSLAISYEPSVLELTGGSCNVSGAMLANFDVAKGKGAFAFSGTNTVSGNLFTVTFRVKDAAAFGTTDVSLTVTLKDGSNKVISLTNNDGSITVKCNHSFTKEDTSYLKSEATCTSPTVYYKSCAICGEKGTETFEHGATAEHSYTKQVTTDAYKKSSASCTAKAVYYYCCATCDAKGTTTYEYGTTLDHNYTRKVVTDTYKKSAATCTDAAVYYYCCATCDAKGTTTYINGSELGHTGGTATCTTKAECTRCHQPYGNMLKHVYTDQDATATYLKSAATCTSKAMYYKNCATCDKAGAATFEYGFSLGHDAQHHNAKAPTCTEIGWDAYVTCSRCDYTTYAEKSALGHSYKRTEVLKWAIYTCSSCNSTYQEDLIFRPIALSSTAFSTAWSMEFTSELKLSENVNAGEKIILFFDAENATLLSVSSDSSTVEYGEDYLVLTAKEALESGAILAELTFKTSDFLTVGEHTVISTVTDAEADFAPIVIYEMGDVNMDGKVNSRDVVMIKQHVVKMITLTEVQLAYANVYVDESLNSRDAVLIQQFIVKMPVELGDRKDVTFVADTEKKGYTVREGYDFTAVPKAPEGYAWSGSEETYTAPIYKSITEDTVYYLVKILGEEEPPEDNTDAPNDDPNDPHKNDNNISIKELV